MGMGAQHVLTFSGIICINLSLKNLHFLIILKKRSEKGLSKLSVCSLTVQDKSKEDLKNLVLVLLFC